MKYIDIYEDPITRAKLEGRAQVIRMTHRDDYDGLNRWLVRFQGDPHDETYERTIHVNQTTEFPSCLPK